MLLLRMQVPDLMCANRQYLFTFVLECKEKKAAIRDSARIYMIKALDMKTLRSNNQRPPKHFLLHNLQ